MTEPSVATGWVLTAVATLDSVDAALIAAATDLSRREVETQLAAAAADGHLQDAAPAMTVTARRDVLDDVSASELGAIQRRALDALLRQGPLPLRIARALVDAGCDDPRLVRQLLTLAHETDPAAAAELLDGALRAGADPLDVAAHRSAAALAAGDFDRALHAGEPVLGLLDHPAATLAIRSAAVAHAHRGMLHLSAGLYGYLGPEGLAEDSGSAVWALIGSGEPEQARRLAANAPPSPPTSLGRGLDLMARGIERSLDGDGAEGIGLLIQASSTLHPVGAQLVLPDTPAAVAALAMIGSGDLDAAESVLQAALAADLGGGLARRRHRLLLAWTMMLRGDLTVTQQLVDDAVATGEPDPRDHLMVHALRVGIARRGSDLTALAQAWSQARTSLTGQAVDLYSLLPLGELLVGAARLREEHRLRPQLRAAEALLDRLGQPPLWSSMYHWYGVHAAILTEQPNELIPHADALVAAASTSRFAGILARSGQVWIRVLQADIDPHAVRVAVGELDHVGLGWDATRLAGQAAARTTDRKAMLELMQLARHAQRAYAGEQRAPVAREVLGRSHLTDREWEVARLVLDGVSYRDIGERLFISPKTVEHHVARIRRRLGADSRAEMLEVLRSLAALPDPR